MPRRAVSAAGTRQSDPVVSMPVDMLGEYDGQRVGGVAFFQLWLPKFVDKDLQMGGIGHEFGFLGGGMTR